jgi:hypothetical protein
MAAVARHGGHGISVFDLDLENLATRRTETMVRNVRWATETDPQILRILLTSPKLKTQYDPSKFSPISIRRITNV